MRIPLLSLSWKGVSHGGTVGTEAGDSGAGGLSHGGPGVVWRGCFSRRHGGHGGGGLRCGGLSHGGPGVVWRGSFSRRHGGHGGGLKCKGAFAWRAWGGMEGEFSHGGMEAGVFGFFLFHHGVDTSHAVTIRGPKSYSAMNKDFYDQDTVIIDSSGNKFYISYFSYQYLWLFRAFVLSQ